MRRSGRWLGDSGPLDDLRVRMAVHTGDGQVFDDDYVGFALHVVARLCSAGHGRQVLVSGATRALVADAELHPLGRHRLRDVPEPVEVFQLAGAGLDQDFPPLRNVVDPPTNLPVPADRLVGRDREVIEVAESLEAHRLVTLTGPGGSGKTRLALATAVVGAIAVRRRGLVRRPGRHHQERPPRCGHVPGAPGAREDGCDPDRCAPRAPRTARGTPRHGQLRAPDRRRRGARRRRARPLPSGPCAGDEP